MSDQIAVMNHGKFEQVGTARELYHAPNTAFVAGFVGEANKYEATVDAAYGDAVTLVTQEGMELKGISCFKA